MVNIPYVQMSIHVNSQPNWSEHTRPNSFLSLKLTSGVDPHEMTHHAAFLLGLHCLPYIFKCEKWCEVRSIKLVPYSMFDSSDGINETERMCRLV